jgi:hypothetical protein
VPIIPHLWVDYKTGSPSGYAEKDSGWSPVRTRNPKEIDMRKVAFVGDVTLIGMRRLVR